MLDKVFQNRENEGKFIVSFNKASVTLISKSDKDYSKNPQTNLTYEY